MNKKGQTLVVFVIFIPIIILILAIVVDMGVIFAKKNQTVEIIRTAIRECNKESNKKECIKNILIKNQVDVNNLEVINNDNKIEVNNKIEIDSIFGNIIGKKSYTIVVNILE